MKSVVRATWIVVFLIVGLGHALAASPSPTPDVDPKAMALLKRAEAEIQSARSMICDVYYIGSAPVGSSPGTTRTLSVLQFKRPNLAHVKVFDETKSNSGVWSKSRIP